MHRGYGAEPRDQRGGGPDQSPPQWRDPRWTAPDPGTPDRSRGSWPTHLPGTRTQVADRLLDDIRSDASCLIRVSDEQAMVANGVHHTWNASRIARDAGHRFLGEHTSVTGARHSEAGANVVPGSRDAHRRDDAHHPDPLFQLAQLGKIEPRLQLGLPNQHDLQNLFFRGLEVRQKADLLEG